MKTRLLRPEENWKSNLTMAVAFEGDYDLEKAKESAARERTEEEKREDARNRCFGTFLDDGTDVLIGVGPLAKHIVEGFKNRENSAWFASNAEAIAYLKGRLHPGDAVLCKGARGMHMDEIIHALSE